MEWEEWKEKVTEVEIHFIENDRIRLKYRILSSTWHTMWFDTCIDIIEGERVAHSSEHIFMGLCPVCNENYTNQNCPFLDKKHLNVRKNIMDCADFLIKSIAETSVETIWNEGVSIFDFIPFYNKWKQACWNEHFKKGDDIIEDTIKWIEKGKEKEIYLSEAMIKEMFERIRESEKEEKIWKELVFLYQPLPTSIAFDLMVRNVAIKELSQTKQEYEVMRLLADKSDQALLNFAQEIYTQRNYGTKEVERLFIKYRNQKKVMDYLKTKRASSHKKQRIFDKEWEKFVPTKP